MKLGDLSVAYVELLARAARAEGFDPVSVLEAYQLPASRLALPGNRVSIPRFMRTGQALIEASAAPWLGLRMGALTGPANLGLAGWIAHSAATLRDACEALVRYELLFSFNARGRSAFIVEQGRGQLQFYSISPYNEFNRFVVDSVLVGWMSVLNQACGEQVVTSVCVEFDAPDYAEAYSRFIPCPVQFGAGCNALVLRDGTLERSLSHPCASQFRYLCDLADAELAQVRNGLSMAEQVARAISPLLKGKTPELAEVAAQMGKPGWTIKRLLAAENTSFQTVLNDARRELATCYLRETVLTMGEIAYLTGFGSATAFQRAFKRWTHETPRQYRQL
tara:strand:+ start:276 stop:1280 length:1005 start_codon:yes stop_codon:yes gene_type:complete